MSAQSSLLARHISTPTHATAVASHEPPDRHVTHRALYHVMWVQHIFTLLLELYIVQADKEFSRALEIRAACSGGPVPLQLSSCS
jgi:hypothetical protein